MMPERSGFCKYVNVILVPKVLVPKFLLGNEKIGDRLLITQISMFELFPKRLSVDPQNLSGFGAVAFGENEGLPQQCWLGFCQEFFV